jgi:LuxR family maltose regulon positive regulatory protein
MIDAPVVPVLPDGASPPDVAHAVVRSGVLDRLEARWDHTVTTVVAGAGFGKSVALGQALRAHRSRPRGVEAWLSCRAGCESPDRLAASVETAFGAPTGAGSATDRLYGVFAGLVPLHAVLVLDDVELLADGPAAALDDLLRRMPANLHLLLCGRRLPPLGLARFRASGDLAEVDADDLRFDRGEVAALAARLGTEPPAVDLGGWPALVRLALVASRSAVADYLWEEVVRALDPPDRRALLALCLLGTSGAADVEAVIGEPFDAEGFSDRVPLVLRVGDRIMAHDLWAPHVGALGSDDDVADLSQRVLAVAAARDDAVAAGAVALRLGDRTALRRCAVELVRTTLGNLPVDVASSWLASLCGPGGDATPEVELLACALTHARASAEPPAERLDAVTARFRAAGDQDGEAVALALAGLAADARKDVPHLVSLAEQARALADGQDSPRLRFLVTGVDAAVRAIGSGDLGGALELLDRPVAGVALTDRPEALLRLHWHFLILDGRAGDAAALVEDRGPTLGKPARDLAGVARWLDGEPDGLLAADVETGPDRYEGLSERDTYDQAAFVAAIAASGPYREPVDRAVAILDASTMAATTGTDGAKAAVARACQAVVHRDDERAVAIVDEFVNAGPIDGFADAHLRRTLAVPYVCSAELRRRWDALELGPSQRRARDVARLLLAVRAGDVPATPPCPLGAVCTALPLVWTVELAARAAARAAWGMDLATKLTDLFGEDVLPELRRLLGEPEERVRRGAAAVLAALPARPAAAVRIRLLGPLEVHHDATPVDTPESRRTRVRELLSLLAVERTISRDRVVDLLWPDLDPTRGRANLRVTLRHLQRLLEPDRVQGAAPYFLRGDAQRLQLAAVPGLDVDVWEVEDLLAEAEAARRRGDQDRRIDHLRGVAARWQGRRPLPDLERLADLDHVPRHLHARLVEAALTLGELELVGGAVDAAATLADQVLTADPYAERAHRLAIAAYMQGRDRAATAAAVDRLGRMLDDLGARPESTTQILVGNAARWLGPAAPGTTPPGSG